MPVGKSWKKYPTVADTFGIQICVFLDIAEAMYPVRQESLRFIPKILPVEYLEYLLTNINF